MVIIDILRWTKRDELYVIEFGRNIDGLVDAFSEKKFEWGINIYHLFDRIHFFHGKSVCYRKE